MIKVTLATNDSKYFPVLASWKIGKVEYTDVYETREAAVNYLSGMYGRIEIVDNR